MTGDMVLLHTLQQQPGLGWLDDMALVSMPLTVGAILSVWYITVCMHKFISESIVLRVHVSTYIREGVEAHVA